MFIDEYAAEWPGCFMVLEGMDGSGKSTISRLLEAELSSQGHSVLLVNEPGGTEVGQAIREVFLKYHQDAVAEVEVGLLVAAKAQLLRTKVLPALKEGKVVLCDRYTYSLMAYQHALKGYPKHVIRGLLEAFSVNVVPDQVLYLDVSANVSLGRTEQRRVEGGPINTLDEIKLDQRIRLRDGFKEALQTLYVEDVPFSRRENLPIVTTLDAEAPVEKVLTEALQSALAAIHYKKARRARLAMTTPQNAIQSA